MESTGQFHDDVGVAGPRISEDVFDDVASFSPRDHLFHHHTNPGDEPMVGFVLFFKEPFTSKWFFYVEILFGIKNTGNKNQTHLEYPISEWTVREGSKLSPLDFLATPLELLKIYFKYC
jgi:hypothetical protein